MQSSKVEGSIEAPENANALALAVDKLTHRTPEEIATRHERVMKTIRRGRPLPEGKNLADVVVGQWPGDETDEQIFEALARLS